MADNNSKNGIVAIVAILVIAVVGILFFYGKDDRNAVQKIGDAISELPRGTGEASEQLEDRSPADKAADAVGDAVDDIKEGE